MKKKKSHLAREGENTSIFSHIVPAWPPERSARKRNLVPATTGGARGGNALDAEKIFDFGVLL